MALAMSAATWIACGGGGAAPTQTLQASFQCPGLTATSGTSDRLDVLDGSFRCTVTGP